MRSFFGTHGNSAIKTFKNRLDKEFRKGHLPHINLSEKKQIIDRVEKIFTKNGKEPVKFGVDKLQKEVFNPLRYKHNDSLDMREVGEVEKKLGFTKVYTKKIGSKYSEIIRAQKKLEFLKRTQKKEESEKKSKPAADFIEFRKKLDKTIDERKNKILSATSLPKAAAEKAKESKAPNSGSPEKGAMKQGLPAKPLKTGKLDKADKSDKIDKTAKEVKGSKKPQLKSGGFLRIAPTATKLSGKIIDETEILQKDKMKFQKDKISKDEEKPDEAKEEISLKPFNSDITVKEAKGFKPSKARKLHEGFYLDETGVFLEKNPGLDNPDKEFDSGMLHKMPRDKKAQDMFDYDGEKPAEEIPKWKLEAYETEPVAPSDTAGSLKPSETQNNDIDA